MVGPNDRYISKESADPAGRPLREIDPNKPILFLDVDGVVNAMNHDLDTHAWPQAHLETAQPFFAPGVGWPIRTSPHIGPALMALDVNVVWLTTWKYDANPSISPLCGLPEDLPVGDWTGTRRLSEGFQDWKTKVVLKALSDHPAQRIIWVDDEAIPFWFDDLMRDQGEDDRVLLVRTNSFNGLTPNEVTFISSWLERNGKEDE